MTSLEGTPGPGSYRSGADRMQFGVIAIGQFVLDHDVERQARLTDYTGPNAHP